MIPTGDSVSRGRSEFCEAHQMWDHRIRRGSARRSRIQVDPVRTPKAKLYSWPWARPLSATRMLGVTPIFGPAGGGTSITVDYDDTRGELEAQAGRTTLNCTKLQPGRARCCCMPLGGGRSGGNVTVLTRHGAERWRSWTFALYAEPELLWLEPKRGPLEGGTSVTIGVHGLPSQSRETARCKFGGMPPVRAVVAAASAPDLAAGVTRLMCVAPDYAAGHEAGDYGGSVRVTLAPNGVDFPVHVRSAHARTGLSYHYAAPAVLSLAHVFAALVAIAVAASLAYGARQACVTALRSSWLDETPPHWSASAHAETAEGLCHGAPQRRGKRPACPRACAPRGGAGGRHELALPRTSE